MKDSILKNTKIICAMRGFTEEQTLRAAEAMIKGGVNAVEVTCNTSGAKEIIASLAAHFGSDLLLGAGTVLTPEQARQSVGAGAGYLLSPCLDSAVMAEAKALGVPMLPGAFTPTEIYTAYSLGAEMVKLFPVTSVGAKYVKDVLAPLDCVKIMPMGGICLENADEFMKAGAVALGLGSSLAKKSAILGGNYDEITETAKKFVEIVNKY